MKVLALLTADLLIFNRWFRRQSLARLVVAFCFLLIFAMLSGFIFVFSRTFFSSLIFFEQYGQFVTNYVLQAGVLVLFWFGWITAFIASLVLVLGRSAQYEYLMTLPVTGRQLAFWSQIKVVITNFLLLSLILGPAILGYQLAASSMHLIWLTVALICLTLLTLGMGMSTAYLWMALFRKHLTVGFLVAIGAIVASGLVIIRLVFPPDLLALYSLPIDQFFTVVSQLPLIHNNFYTNWIVSVANGILGSAVSLITLTTVVYLFGYITHAGFLEKSWRMFWSRSETAKARFLGVWQRSSNPLILKDVYTVIRLRKELVYAVLQLSLAAVMFGLLQRATLFRPLSRLEQSQIIGLTFGWLMFFAASFLLRFVYPLVAREGRTLWFILPLVSRSKLLMSKLISALLLSSPLLILDALLWLVSPLPMHSLLIVFSIVSLLVMTVFVTLLGFISPDFSLAWEAEKTSTSLMGLLGLAICLVWTWTAIQSLNSFLNGQPTYGLISLACATAVLLVMGSLATRANYRK